MQLNTWYIVEELRMHIQSKIFDIRLDKLKKKEKQLTILRTTTIWSKLIGRPVLDTSVSPLNAFIVSATGPKPKNYKCYDS